MNANVFVVRMEVIKYELCGPPLDSFKKSDILSQVRSPNNRKVQQTRPNKSEIQQLPDRDRNRIAESSSYEA